MEVSWERPLLTVSPNEEDDEVKAAQDATGGYATVRIDPVVHNHVPVFTGQDLIDKESLTRRR